MGIGVPKDDSIAFHYYKKSTKNHFDYGRTFLILGDCYKSGRGVDKDYVKAAEMYREAALQNNAEAQYKLGVCYFDGFAYPKDYAEAVKWLRKAAEQGYPKAQYELGMSYLKGRGVAPDVSEGKYWVKKAANRGNRSAIHFCKKKGW
jgi:TPR repeat protein